MNSYSLSRAARKDLKAIAVFTQKTWGANQRRAYIKALDDAFRYLSEQPSVGTQCNYVLPDLRKHHCKSHTIFFEVNSPNSIFIVRILHKSMDVDRHLTNS
jgi:toxin ParE1/3/4